MGNDRVPGAQATPFSFRTVVVVVIPKSMLLLAPAKNVLYAEAVVGLNMAYIVKLVTPDGMGVVGE